MQITEEWARTASEEELNPICEEWMGGDHNYGELMKALMALPFKSQQKAGDLFWELRDECHNSHLAAKRTCAIMVARGIVKKDL